MSSPKSQAIEACVTDDQHVIAFQFSKDQWNYKCLTTSELIIAMQKRPEIAKHESIHRKCKLYFDIEMYDKPNLDIDEYIRDFKALVNEHILNHIDQDLQESIWFKRKSCREKVSLHVVFPHVWFNTRTDIMPYLTQLNRKEIDPIVYRCGMLRVPYSCKPGGDINTCIVPLNDDTTFNCNIFLSGLVSYGQVKFMFPSQSEAPNVQDVKRLRYDNMPHEAHVERLYNWFQHFWGDFKKSGISKHDTIPNMYSFQNLKYTYCQVAKRCHISNKCYVSMLFNDDAKHVTIWIYCTDCQQKWRFPLNLSCIAYGPDTVFD